MSTLRLIDTDTGVRLNFLSTAATVSKFCLPTVSS
jgi:hypothetical protein